MEEFKVVMQILYKENKYLILLNTRHQKYFLKILDDEKFMYPTMQEFTELYNIFESMSSMPHIPHDDCNCREQMLSL